MKHFLILLLLCLAVGIHAEEQVCEVDRPSIVERVINRSYPSVYAAWGHQIMNEPLPEDIWEWTYYRDVLPRRDMFWQGSFIANVYFQYDGSDLVFRRGEGKDWVIDRRNEIQTLNPNFLFLAAFYYYGTTSEKYSEDWPYWLRNEAGHRMRDDFWGEILIDFTLPGAEDHFVEMAESVKACGIFDGIFLDLWSEDKEELPGTPDEEFAHLYHGNQVEAVVSLVKRIREAVGDDFLIIVNTRTLKIPRSAPYVNGAFIETWDDAYPRERLIEIETALSWYEKNFRYPQVNCLNIAINPNEPWNSPGNHRLARTTTTLGLTHSNGYILIKGKFNDEPYWYPFFDAPLGRPIGAKGETYENRDGLFIREFTNGWAVYNRSGQPQTVGFPMKTTGFASGSVGETHTVPDLDGEIYIKQPTNGDVNADGVVNILDLVLVANALGELSPDLNGDGVVNVLDLVLVSNSMR